MVQASSLKALSVAIIVGAASAFTPPSITNSASFGISSSRPLSPPTPLSMTTTTSLDSSSIVIDKPNTEILPTKEQSSNRRHNTDKEMDPNGNWLLRIYNDNINTREYVAVCLVQVTGLCESRAYYTMQQAHSNGIAKVGEYNQEVAECYEDQLNERGIVCDVIAKE